MNHAATDVATLLDVRAVLRSLGRAARPLADAEETEDALRIAVEALVPLAADSAEAFVVAGDGRLQRKAVANGHLDASADGDLPRESTHPAALAVRAGAVAVLDGDEPPLLLRGEGDRAPIPDEFAAVALPIFREDHPAGALWLRRGPGRRYARDDLGVLLDLGERISQMLENRRLRKEVRAAQRAKGDFLAVVNHELRTPLTAVVGYADLLEAGIPGPVTEKQRRQLARIKESAWDLLELIDGILGYARYEGENPDLHLRMVDPESLLQDAMRVVEGAAEEKGLAVKLVTPGPLPSFPTDPEKARRILFHLLSNAVKFTPEGEIRVEIRADADWVAYSVTDTGIGIRPEERDSIFEPFWQGERPERRTAGGAGMGLSLAQRLTELLSGEIDVESVVGHGSTFTVRFPRQGPRPASL